MIYKLEYNLLAGELVHSLTGVLSSFTCRCSIVANKVVDLNHKNLFSGWMIPGDNHGLPSKNL